MSKAPLASMDIGFPAPAEAASVGFRPSNIRVKHLSCWGKPQILFDLDQDEAVALRPKGLRTRRPRLEIPVHIVQEVLDHKTIDTDTRLNGMWVPKAEGMRSYARGRFCARTVPAADGTWMVHMTIAIWNPQSTERVEVDRVFLASSLEQACVSYSAFRQALETAETVRQSFEHVPDPNTRDRYLGILHGLNAIMRTSMQSEGVSTEETRQIQEKFLVELGSCLRDQRTELRDTILTSSQRKKRLKIESYVPPTEPEQAVEDPQTAAPTPPVVSDVPARKRPKIEKYHG